MYVFRRYWAKLQGSSKTKIQLVFRGDWLTIIVMARLIDNNLLQAFQDDLNEILNEWERVCVRKNAGKDAYLELKRCAHNIKGNAGLLGFDQLKESIHRLEERLTTLETANADPNDPSLRIILFELEKFFRSWVEKLVKDPDYKEKNLSVFSKFEAWTSEADAEGEKKEEGAIQDPVKFISDTSTVRVPSQKLDLLIQTVGELTLSQAIISRSHAEGTTSTPMFHEAVAHCDKLVRSLRATTLDLRMLPLAGLYHRLERAAMELSVQLKKPLEILTEGQDVAVDKAVLNRIFDPLLHLVRNAIDHGLENPQERKTNGKPSAGVVRISATVVPTGVKIIVQDDGRGLNFEKIAKKAIGKGLISSSKNLQEAEILKLIFEPGFSTSDIVTDISGRGVGLDIVKRELLNLGGQIDVHTEMNKGTKFTLTLPTNVSLIDVLVIRSQKQLHCVPTQDVAEIIDGDDIKVESSSMFRHMIKVRGKVLPIEPIEHFLDKKTRKEKKDIDGGCILVVKYREESMGIWIEGIDDKQQVFVRPLKGFLSTLEKMTGTTVLSNGEPSMILNVKEMAYSFFEDNNRGVGLGEQII